MKGNFIYCPLKALIHETRLYLDVDWCLNNVFYRLASGCLVLRSRRVSHNFSGLGVNDANEGEIKGDRDKSGWYLVFVGGIFIWIILLLVDDFFGWVYAGMAFNISVGMDDRFHCGYALDVGGAHEDKE